eukprot:m51a1_g1294 hypothetical protein (362) ;mRNA; r:183103-184454
METKVIKVDPNSFADEELAEAVALLRAGEVVAFPTETVYGLGANALDAAAVARVFAAKGRPADNPLIVHVSQSSMLPPLASRVSDAARRLSDRFWPGPLTLVMPRTPAVPNVVTAGLDTVAVRMPSHPIARRLIELSGVPIAAPSANASGRPSPTRAHHVYEDLKGRIPLIIDGGACEFGVESTVVDPERSLVLRPGGVTLEQLKTVVPDMHLFSSLAVGTAAAMLAHPPTPGLKYRHYSPRAAVVLVLRAANPELSVAAVEAAIREAKGRKLRVGFVRTHKDWEYSSEVLADVTVRDLGDEASSLADIEHNLFAALRDLDGDRVDEIVVEGIRDQHQGLAVMNRLHKAAVRTIDPSQQSP